MSEKITCIDSSQFSSAVLAAPRAVVDFYSTECPPCEAFAAKYEAALVTLRAELYDSGVAADVLAQWAEIVDASGLVAGATVVSEAASVATFFS
jgi:thiol-disulfide isomerase/thioredoxin